MSFLVSPLCTLLSRSSHLLADSGRRGQRQARGVSRLLTRVSEKPATLSAYRFIPIYPAAAVSLPSPAPAPHSSSSTPAVQPPVSAVSHYLQCTPAPRAVSTEIVPKTLSPNDVALPFSVPRHS